MSPLVEAILGALIRNALVAVSGYVVAHHWLTADQAKEASEQLAPKLVEHLAVYGPIVVGVAWSLFAKYRARLLHIAAAELPAGASDEQIARKANDPTVRALIGKTL